MVTSLNAFESGYAALQNFPDRDKPGDIAVELVGDHFRVQIFAVITPDRALDHLLEASVDAASGKVLKTEDKGRVAGLPERSADPEWQSFQSARRAYDLALAAIRGFEDYDKQGRLTVQLRKNIYYVTFPLPPDEHRGSRAPDFAMQVWLDARTGAVIKKLVAS